MPLTILACFLQTHFLDDSPVDSELITELWTYFDGVVGERRHHLQAKALLFTFSHLPSSLLCNTQGCGLYTLTVFSNSVAFSWSWLVEIIVKIMEE